MQLLSTLFFIPLLFLLTPVQAVFPISVEGNEFFNSVTKQRFVIVGVAYQPGGASGYDPAHGVDPLSDPKKCLRDAALMQRLGVNTIRVYNVNPDLDHDMCMSIFDSVGIYVLLDVNSPLDGESINRHAPSGTYKGGYMSRVFKVVEAFRAYDNLIGFIAGNEVVNDERSARTSPPYVRAVIRDIKEYIKHREWERKIPVGYAANDDSMRQAMHDYLTCEDSAFPLSNADFFGINSYQWCGDATYQTSGYDKLYDAFSKSPVPVFFSEYGCNAERPRSFSDIPVVYGQMLPAWDGGILYEYTEEANNYGLVEVNEDDQSVRLLKDYDNLQARYNKLDVKELRRDQSNNSTRPQCGSDAMMGAIKAIPYFNANFRLPGCQTEECKHAFARQIKPGHVGRIVNVKSIKSPYAAYGSDGSPIKNLQIFMYDDTHMNIPSNQNTSGNASIVKDEAGFQPETKEGWREPPKPPKEKKSNAMREGVPKAMVWAWISLVLLMM